MKTGDGGWGRGTGDGGRGTGSGREGWRKADRGSHYRRSYQAITARSVVLSHLTSHIWSYGRVQSQRRQAEGKAEGGDPRGKRAPDHSQEPEGPRPAGHASERRRRGLRA